MKMSVNNVLIINFENEDKFIKNLLNNLFNKIYLKKLI